MLGIRTPAQATEHLNQVARTRYQDSDVDLTDQDTYITGLASRIRRDWSQAKTDKIKVEHNMLECLRERKGEYGPEELSAIRSAGGSDIYIKLASSKVRAGIAHIKSVLLPEGDRAHGIAPTKNPTLPDWINDKLVERILQNPLMVDDKGQPIPPLEQLDLLQNLSRREMSAMAKRRARNMDRKIQDQLQEGGWADAMSQFIDDICTLPAAFMKGPYFSHEPRLTYQFGREGFRPQSSIQMVMKFRTINPLDAYPAAGSDSVHKGNFIERLRMNRNDLLNMRNSNGYDKKAIDEVLRHYRNGSLNNWLWTDQMRSQIADHTSHWNKQTTELDGLHWYGKAMGYELIEGGVSATLIDEPLREYECDAILIGTQIVRAALNLDPLHRRIIDSTCYEKIPGSVFGNSPSMLMRSTSRMVNATGRALQNNLAHASGFQADVDYTRVSAETDPFDIHPFKVWQTRESEFAGDRPAVRFFQPESNAPELINVIDYFKRMADNDTGIPELLSGGTGQNTGADATAKGRAMLLDQSATILLSAIMNIDRDVCMKKVKMMYDYNMLNDPDEEIKGDCQVVPKGINARLQMDTARMSHMALLEVTGNDPEAKAIMGVEGRAKLLKSLFKTFEDIDIDDVIPSDEELERKVAKIENTPPPPDPALLKVQAQQEEAQGKLQLEARKLDMEAQREQMRMQADASKLEQENEIAKQKFMAERALKMMDMKSREQVANIEAQGRVQSTQVDAAAKLQSTTQTIRADRIGQRERAKLDMVREKFKATQAVKVKLMDMKPLPGENADSNSNNDLTTEDIRSVVESVVAPMISTFQSDTAKIMDELTATLSADPSVFNINVDATSGPVVKRMTTSRDSTGNLQATITPESR